MAGDPSGIEAARAEVAAHPEDPDRRVRLALLLLDAGSAADALGQAQEALVRRPADLEAFDVAARACRALGDEDRAAAYQRLLDAMLQQDAVDDLVPDSPAEILEEWSGTVAVQESDLAVLGRGSSSLDDVDLSDRARALIEVGRLGEARDLLVGAGVPDVVDPEAAFVLAQVLLALALPKAALDAADAGLAQAPNVAWGHRLRAAAMARLGAVVPALEAAEEAVRLAPDEAISYLGLAHICLGVDDVAGAREAAAKALSLDPDMVGAHVLLGRIAIDDDRLDAAERHFDAALGIDPGNADARNGLGVVEVRRDRMEAARAHFDDASALDPAGPGADNARIVGQMVAHRELDRQRRWARLASYLLNPVLGVWALRFGHRTRRDGRPRRVIVLWSGSRLEATIRVGLSLVAWAMVVAGLAGAVLWPMLFSVLVWRLALELASVARDDHR